MSSAADAIRKKTGPIVQKLLQLNSKMLQIRQKVKSKLRTLKDRLPEYQRLREVRREMAKLEKRLVEIRMRCDHDNQEERVESATPEGISKAIFCEDCGLRLGGSDR